MVSRNQKRRIRSKKTGHCSDCLKSKRLKEMSYCYICYMKRAAHRHLGSAKRWKELDALLIQQLGRCAYTGRPIVLGVNASIEHVEPISRSPGRASDIANLRWVEKEVNLAKRSMTLKEFLDMCKYVLKNFGYVVTRKR